MKNIFKMTFVLLVSVNLHAKEANENSNDENLKAFITGKYQLIGKKLNSDQSYMGVIEIKLKDKGFVFHKTIEKNSYKGTAHIESTLHDSVKVLRLRYNDGDKKIEETCLFHSDLDNYARISCHLYEKDQATDSPGLEALFIQHQD